MKLEVKNMIIAAITIAMMLSAPAAPVAAAPLTHALLEWQQDLGWNAFGVEIGDPDADARGAQALHFIQQNFILIETIHTHAVEKSPEGFIVIEII